MACFLVPVAEAIVVSAATQILLAKEKKASACPVSVSDDALPDNAGKTSLSSKLRWLSRLLFGGSALLMFEHLWHGEVVPWFPFLTAASDAAEAAQMLHEMATVGVSMAVLITAVWGVMCLVSSVAVRKAKKASEGGKA